jgi:putative ABC transport system permease protein
MLKNYLKIAYRNFLRNKTFFLINIFGLVTGLASCLLIAQFLSYELSFDNFHKEKDRIFRLTNDRFQKGMRVHHGVTTYPAVGPAMAKDYPEIERHTRFMHGFGNLSVKLENDIDIHNGGIYFFADNQFLSVFTFPLLAGDSQSALNEPYSIVVTKSKALAYFNSEDKDLAKFLGKNIYLGTDKQPYAVTGICQDIPENSHLKFDALVSYATLIRKAPIAEDSWMWSDMRHYFLLRKGVDHKKLQDKFEDFIARHFQGDQLTGSVEKFFLQPLDEIHLYSDYEYDLAQTTNGKVVWGMLIIACFILGLALINYVTLTTSRAIDRAKEVSIRKVIGSKRAQVMLQFIIESLITLTISLALAIVTVAVLQPMFNLLFGINLQLLQVISTASPVIILSLVCTLILTLFLASFYPAFILSSSQPALALKGIHAQDSGNLLRKGLVIFQFAIATTLVIGTDVVSRQLQFLNEADLGLNIKQTLIINPPERIVWDSVFLERMNSFTNEALSVNGVHSVATSNRLPGQRLPRIFKVYLKDQPSENHYTMSTMGIGLDFFDSYKIELIAGRNFVPGDYSIDWSGIKSLIINETAAKSLGFNKAGDALGRELFIETRFFMIVGVVEDFHQESMKRPKEPMMFRPLTGISQFISVKLDENMKQQIIVTLQASFKKFFHDNPFHYYFLEDSYNNLYYEDNRFKRVIQIFSLLTVIISCLGLIGLSSYSVMQRTKEISIRKVLGASYINTISLLSMSFIKLVLIAILVALPLAYVIMQNWLAGYAYRIELAWFYIIAPGFFVLLIAVVTVAFQVLKMALISPAKSLKYE